MTEVETLLSVDAGRTPPGTVAFFMDDGDRRTRMTRAALAALMGLGAIALAFTLGKSGLAPVTLLVLGAAIAGVRAMPTLRDDDRPAGKRQVMVVTAGSLIVRGPWGLKTWRFEDLDRVVAGLDTGRAYLELLDKNGSRYTLECSGFRRCERARRVISSRLALLEPRRAYQGSAAV
jgi:hypothetical protein